MAKKSKKQMENKKKKSGTLIVDHETLKNTASLSSVDDQYKRIYKVLAVEVGEDEEDDEVASVSDENLEKYLAYLKRETVFPVTVTGIEDMGCFRWEERYIFGAGNQTEYENLKKKNPSFTDTYELLGFNEDFDEDEGLYAEVQRISDRKKFTLPLADLKTVEKNSKNSQLLHDYAVWYANFR